MKLWTITILAIVLVTGAFFVWPSPYRYDNLRGLPTRTNRLTDATEYLTTEGWKSHNIPAATQGTDGPGPLPAGVLEKVTGNAFISPDGVLTCTIYNGSNWKVTALHVELTVRDAAGATIIDRRKYELRIRWGGGDGKPFTSTPFVCDLGFSIAPAQTWNWAIAGAKGYSE